MELLFIILYFGIFHVFGYTNKDINYNDRVKFGSLPLEVADGYDGGRR